MERIGATAPLKANAAILSKGRVILSEREESCNKKIIHFVQDDGEDRAYVRIPAGFSRLRGLSAVIHRRALPVVLMRHRTTTGFPCSNSSPPCGGSSTCPIWQPFGRTGSILSMIKAVG